MLRHPGADGGTVGSGKGCRWREHCGGDWYRMDELATAVFGDT